MEFSLRYGLNPHQAPARACSQRFPFRIVNGEPGTINLLDALMSWQVVRELPPVAAASVKHTHPAGVAVAATPTEAYAAARDADPVASYGDWVALNVPCDLAAAESLRRLVSDGIIAPGFETGVVDVLAAKKGGRFVVLEADPFYEPPDVQRREVFGVTLEQHGGAVDDEPRTVAWITVKHAVSNAVVLALDDRTIGIGCGQQSRIAATRLACEKAEVWWLRRHPRVEQARFRHGVRGHERQTAIDLFLRGELYRSAYVDAFAVPPEPLTSADRSEWIGRLDGVTMASDGAIPFPDNVERAARSGVRTIVHPGGSARDDEVAAAASRLGVTIVETGVRAFHH